jgi:hypothetical protein
MGYSPKDDTWGLRGIYRLILFESIGALDSTLRALLSPENGTFQEYFFHSYPPLVVPLFGITVELKGRNKESTGEQSLGSERLRDGKWGRPR